MPRDNGEIALPVDARNRYNNSISYDAPVRTDALANQVVKQIAAYSAGTQNRPEKYYLNAVDNLGIGNRVLQIRDKTRQNDPGENEVEIDFGGMGEAHIRTKDNVEAIITLRELQKELTPEGAAMEEMKDLSTVLKQAEAALQAKLSVDEVNKLKALQDIEITNNTAEDHQINQAPNDTTNTEHAANTQEYPENQPHTEYPEHSPTSLLKKLKIAFVSAVDRHTSKVTYTDWRGKEVVREVKSKDVITKASEQYAAMKMSETKERREGNWFKKIADRVWRGTLTEQVHKVKEKFHGLKLMEAAKVETGITAEFDAEIDKLARQRIQSEYDQKNWFQKGIYNVQNAAQEVLGFERDLHKKKVVITAELRAKYEADPANADNPLFHLVHRDVVSREALADSVMGSDLDFLHAGDKKTESLKIERGSKMDNFLKNEILLKIKDDIVSQSEKRQYTGSISPELRMKLDKKLQDYFFSDEFEEWRKSLDPEVQKQFENSFTYATNLLSQTEASFVPLIHESHDQFKSVTTLDMDIEIMLGTAKFGPNGEVDSPSIFDKERVSLNQQLYDRVREKGKAGANKTDVLFNPGEFPQGLKWETTMAAMNSVAYSEFAAAYAGAVTTRFIMTSARASVSWLPILGGSLMAGGVSGFKEFRKLKEMRKQFSREKAQGYEHPGGANAVRSEQMRRYAYHTVDLGHRDQQLEGVTEKLLTGDKSEETILLTFAYLADTKARRTLGDMHDDNLFDADKSTPEGRANYHAQEGIMNKTASLGMTRLSGLLDGDANSALRTQIATRMGMDPTRATDARSIMLELARAQADHLKSGVTVPDSYKVVMGMDKDLVIDAKQAMTVKDKAFNEWVWGQSLMAAGRTTALAVVFQVGAGQLQELQVSAGETVEHVQTTLLDHDLPTHVTGLPNNGGQFYDPTTNELLDMHYTHIPAGTHWVVDKTDPQAYDLVLDNDPSHQILSDATFAKDGTLISTMELTNQINANHLDIDYTQHAVDVAGSSAEGVSTDTVDLHAWELPGYKEEGFWGWYKTTLSHDGHQATDQEMNAVLKTARGVNIWHNHSNNVVLDPTNEYAAVQVVHERDLDDGLFGEGTVDLMAAPQGSSAIFKDVPSTWGTAEGHQSIADTFNEAKAQVEAGIPFTNDLEGEAHRIVYEAGIDGEHGIPDEQEVNILLQYFSASTPAQAYTLNDIHISMSEDLVTVKDIPHEWVGNPYKYMAPGYFRPLEAVVAKEDAYRTYPMAYPMPYPDNENNKNKTEYPEYQNYLETYPLTDENVAKYQQYYPKYPEYKPDATEANKVLPYYESLYDSLSLTEAEREKIRTLNPDQRIVELYKLTDYEIDESRPYVLNVLYLHAITSETLPNNQRVSNVSRAVFQNKPLTLTSEKLEEYKQHYPQYPEYQSDPIEASKILPYYESIYEALKLTPETQERMRTLTPEERVVELYKLADYEMDSTRPYEANIFYLNAVVEDPTLAFPKDEVLNEQRVKSQSDLLESIKTKYVTNSKDAGVLRTLHRLNGAERSYHQELELLNKELPPMNEKCEMVAIIPAFNEEGKIQATVEGWLNQYDQKTGEKLDPDKFEVIILLNRPNDKVAFDNTKSVIDKIKADEKYAGYHIHVVEKTFNFATDKEVNTTINDEQVKIPKGARMGLIYGTATNLAILRNMERKASDDAKANLIIKPGGADVYARSKYYIDRAIKTFTNPKVEQWKFRADFPEAINRHVPLFHLTTTFKEMMNAQITRGKTNLGLGMFRASLYAEADGFNPIDEIAEEVRLNERMRTKATTKWQGVAGGGVMRNRVLNALDDPRRAINAVLNGVPVLYEYGSWNDNGVRSLSVDEIIKQPVPEKAQFNPQNIELQINPTFRYYTKQLYKYSSDPKIRNNVEESIARAKKFATRSLSALGFTEGDYAINIPSEETIKEKNLKPEEILDQISINIVNLENVKKAGSEYKAKQIN